MKAHPILTKQPLRIIFTLLAALGLALLSAFTPRAAAQAAGITVSPQLPDQTPLVGAAFSQAFSASGGTSPYTYTTSGTLPPGLTFTASTATLAGTYTTAGDYTVTVTATDADEATGSVTLHFAVRYPSSVSITLTSAAGEGVYLVGSAVTVRATVTPGGGGSQNPTGQVDISTGGGPTCSITLAGGTGTCPLIFTAPGPYSVSASYGGDTNYKTSQTASATQITVQLIPQLSAGVEHTCYLGADGMAYCWGAPVNYSSGAAGPYGILTTGYYQTCGLKANGSLECWSEDASIRNVPTGHQYIAVSGGNSFACAIRTDGTVDCWSESLSDSLTDGLPSFAVKAISAGSDHVCALKASDSTAYCWGDNLGTAPVPSQALESIAAGRHHTCAITASDHHLVCWGSDVVTPSNTYAPYLQVGSGSGYSCALDSNHKIHCWGANAPAVDTTHTYQNLAVGFLHVCALTQGSPAKLACWGRDNEGQAPRLSLTPAASTSVVALSRTWSQAYTPAGGYSGSDLSGYTLNLSGSGLPGWLGQSGFTLSGTPNSLQSVTYQLTLSEVNPAESSLPLALEPVANSYTLNVENPATGIAITAVNGASSPGSGIEVTVGAPVEVSVAISETASPSLSGTVTITGSETGATCQTDVTPNGDGSGGTATCALFFGTTGSKDLTAHYAGDSFFLGADSTTPTPWHVTINPIVIQPMVSAGLSYTCSLDANGQAYCWGASESNQTTPPGGSTFTSLSAGEFHACGVLANSRLACWGGNAYGERTPPVSTGFVAVGAGKNHSCALNYLGQVVCWGYPDSRVTGAPSTSQNRSLSVGGDHACVVNAQGGIHCWGSNAYGQTSVPVQLTLANTSLAVAAGDTFSCALDAAHHLVCWGGVGSSNPILSAPAGEYQSLSAGHDYACAIRQSDQAVVCWGADGGTPRQLASPSGSLTSLEAGYHHACGIASGGALVCWGDNSAGEAPVLSISPTSLETIDPSGTTAFDLHAAGGRPSGGSPASYHYSVDGASLPAGFSLDSSGGRLSRAEDAVSLGGAYHFDVTVNELNHQPALQASFHYNLDVRSPVTLTLTPPDPAAMAGSLVNLPVTVAEDPSLGNHGVTPTGQVSLTMDDGQTCTATLNASGQASCSFFFAEDVHAAAEYTGDSLFMPATAGLDLPITPFDQPAALVSDSARTLLYHPDGSQSCFGAGCPTTRLGGLYTHLASSGNAVCGVGLDGELTCVDNARNLLSVPDGPFFDVAVDGAQTCGLRQNGSILCWDTGQPDSTQALAGHYLSLSAAGDNLCAVTASNGLACWPGTGLTPPTGGSYRQIAVAADHACALTSGGALACWGDDASGQSDAPVGSGYAQVSVGQGFSCALDDAGQVHCWGDGLAPHGDPVGTFIALAAADDHACALRADDKVTCWGDNDGGEAPQFSYQPILQSEIPALQYWEHRFQPAGGHTPYQASIPTGTLPGGILSQAGVVLYGTPTTPGDYDFQVRWEDASPIPIVLELPVHLRVTGADLNVTIQGAHPSVALLENDFSFTYTVENTTALDVPEARLTIRLPENLSGIHVDSTLTCDPVSDGLSCPIHDLPAYSSLPVRVTGRVGGEEGAVLATHAAVEILSAGWTEMDAADNQADCQVTTAKQFVTLQEDFGGDSLGAQWTSGSGALETSPSGEHFLGGLANDSQTLRLTGLPAHQVITLEFDLYVRGDWSGLDPLNPAASTLWSYGIPGSGGPLLLTSFCNQPDCQQSYPDTYLHGAHPGQTGAAQVDFLGYPSQPDARYHVKITLLHSDPSLEIEFQAANLTGSATWGLDNVVVTAHFKPQTLIYLPLTLR